MKTSRKNARPRSPEEQYRLVMECRTSGRTDRAWCEGHGINPETFRNGVKKLRDAQTPGIPPSGRRRGGTAPSPSSGIPQVVRLPSREPDTGEKESVPGFTLEVCLPWGKLCMTNDVSPELLSMVLRNGKEGLCQGISPQQMRFIWYAVIQT